MIEQTLQIVYAARKHVQATVKRAHVAARPRPRAKAVSTPPHSTLSRQRRARERQPTERTYGMQPACIRLRAGAPDARSRHAPPQRICAPRPRRSRSIARRNARRIRSGTWGRRAGASVSPTSSIVLLSTSAAPATTTARWATATEPCRWPRCLMRPRVLFCAA